MITIFIISLYLTVCDGWINFLKPLKITNNVKSDENVSLLFFTGFGKSAYSYEKICERISEKLIKKNIKCDIYIHSYLNDAPVIGDVQTECLAKRTLSELDNKDSKIFFIGHSAGGYFLNGIAEKYGNGLIQMGNVLNSNGVLPWKQYSLRDYSIPTLTILGQKDGYLSHLYARDELQNMYNLSDSLKPVIIESNVNHLQMADDVKTSYATYLNKYDVKSPITLDQAHEQISSSVSEFIKCCFDKNYNSEVINKKLKRTKEYLSEYEASDFDLNYLIQDIQGRLLSDSRDYQIVNTIHETREEFVLSKPRIMGNTIYTESYYDRGIDYYSKYVSLKLKNSESEIVKVTAKAINEELFKNVSKTITGKHNCVKVVFEDDEYIDNGSFTGINWVLKSPRIRFDIQTSTLYIQSPVLKTKSVNPDRYSYMYYMKILSPKLCFELIQLYLR